MKVSYLLLLPVFFLLGCSEKAHQAPEIEIVNVLNTNIKALEDEDIDLVEETTHSESPAYEPSITLMKRIFEQYDLHYELVKYNIDKIDPDEATVSFVQVTTKLKGPDFKNNKITGVHTLKKESGYWKIFNTRIDNIEYL